MGRFTCAAQAGGESGGRFFVRCVFRANADAKFVPDAIRDGFAPVAARFGMAWALHDVRQRAKVLIMVSKLDHCLRDLLYRC